MLKKIAAFTVIAAMTLVASGAGTPAYAAYHVDRGSTAVPPPPAAPRSLAPSAKQGADAAAARLSKQRAAADVVRAEALRQPSPAQPTDSYQISPAAYRFLSAGLGLPVPSGLLTGLRAGASSGTLQTRFTAGPALRYALPADVKAPSFSNTTLVIDTTSDTLTLTASAHQAALSVRIAHASVTTLAGGDLTSRLTVAVPMLGSTVTLSGQLSNARDGVEVSATGTLRAALVLQAGVAQLTRGTRITLTSKDGLRLAGTADLGPAGHQLPVTVTGRLARTDTWSLAVGAAPAAVSGPLPGLALSPAMTGTVTGDHGTVRYDVHATASHTWQALAGMPMSGASLRVSNTLPTAGLLAAPDIKQGTPWVDVTGEIALAAGAVGTVTGQGTMAVNLSTGAAALTGRQAASLPLSTEPARRIVLGAAQFGGLLTMGPAGISGDISGTGLITVTPAAGRPTLARASLRMNRGSGLVAAFPVNGALLGLGASGTLDTAYWSAAAVPGYSAGSGIRLNLPAGISATAPRSSALLRPTTTPAGAPAAGLKASTGTAIAPGAKAAADEPAGSSTYTLSAAAYGFLTQQLGIALGSSATLSGTLTGQTLTLTAGAPGPLPLSLPAGMPTPVFGPTTITVDEAAGTITLTASASAGVTGTLQVTIAHAASTGLSGGADLTATLTLGGVPFIAGSSVTLTGSLSYTGGNLGASLTGSLATALPVAGGAITVQPGTSLSIATGTGLSVTGTALLGSGQNAYALQLTGALSDLKNWSLAVTGQGQPWQALPNLTLYPNFSASLSDQAGTIGFDLASTGIATWSPGANASLAVTGFEVSNQPPTAAVSCPAIETGDVWLDLRGSFGYTPAGVTLNADGCADLASRDFVVKTAATGTLLPGSSGFSLTSASLTASGNFQLSSFAITAGASATVSGPNGHTVSGTAVVSFANGGILAGVSVDLSQLDPSMSGSGEVYISSRQIKPFNPSDYGFGGSVYPATLPLSAGVNVAFSYTLNSLPDNVKTVLNHLHASIPAGTTILALAQVSTAGLAASLDVNFGTNAGGARLFLVNGTSFYLDDVTLGITVGANTSVSVAGAGYLTMPAMWGGGAPSQLALSVTASLSATQAALILGIQVNNWQNAFGVNGFIIGSLGGSIGISENPSLSLSATGIQLPPAWGADIGLAQGATLSLNENMSLTQPLINFSISPGPGGVALTPLAVGYAQQIAAGQALTTDQRTVVNSMQISSASFYLAPFGGTTASGLAILPGLALSFNGSVAGVAVNVEGAVGVSPPSLTVNVSVSGYTLGSITMGGTHFLMNLSPTQLDFGFNGSFLSNGYTFAGTVYLHLGSTSNGARVSFNLLAGLPYYMMVTVALQGNVSVSGSTVQISASAWGGFWVGGSEFGSIWMTFSLSGGVSFADADSIGTLVYYFRALGASTNLMITALEKVGFNTFDLFNALGGDIATYGQSVLDLMFSSTYYDIWVDTPALPLVLDVSGASRSAGAQVLTYVWNGGYNQDWKFVQDPYATDWYEVVNRNSGQCLSAYAAWNSPGTSLVQYPCYGDASQLWGFGSTPSVGPSYVLPNLKAWQPGIMGVMDLQSGYAWPGGIMELWSYAGSWNQHFRLTNSSN